MVEGKAGERLSDVEGRPVGVVVAVVVAVEGGVGTEPAGQQATGQRHPGDDGHVAFPGGAQQGLQRLLAEHVEDDLEGGQPLDLQAQVALLHGLNAGAEGGQQAVLAGLLKPPEHRPVGHDVPGDAVQLDQVQHLHAQPFT